MPPPTVGDSIPRMKLHLPRFAITFTLLLTVAGTAPAQRRPRTPPRTDAQTATAKAQLTPRRVTVRLKQSDPVVGMFVGVEGEAVLVEVAGNRLSIKLDDVASIAFVEEAPHPVPSPQPDPAREAALAAVRSLRKLASAAEIGVTYRDYSSRLIDVKSEVDEALAQMPDGDLKKEVAAAMEAYGDAGQAWSRTLGGGGRYTEASLYPDSDPWAVVMQLKYEIPVEATEPMKGVPDYLLKTAPPGALKPVRYMRQSVILSTMWGAARKHIEQAEVLMK